MCLPSTLSFKRIVSTCLIDRYHFFFSGDEDEGDRDRENERGGGGRGRRGREGFHSSGRMSRRSRLSRGGGKRNRFSRKPNSDLAICKFYIQGKCQRVRVREKEYYYSFFIYFISL